MSKEKLFGGTNKESNLQEMNAHLLKRAYGLTPILKLSTQKMTTWIFLVINHFLFQNWLENIYNAYIVVMNIQLVRQLFIFKKNIWNVSCMILRCSMEWQLMQMEFNYGRRSFQVSRLLMSQIFKLKRELLQRTQLQRDKPKREKLQLLQLKSLKHPKMLK